MKRKSFHADQEKILKLFKKRKRQIFTATLITILITFASLAIVGTQLFYPYHIIIGLGLYIWSFIPIIHRIYLSRKSWHEYKTYDFAQKFFKRDKYYILGGVIFMAFALTFITVRPLGENPFVNLDESALKERVAEDTYKATAAMDYLETTGNTLLETLREETEDAHQADKIRNDFSEFLQAVMYSESLTETYRYFDKISYRYSTERSVSFLISYSLYIKKYELLHRMMFTVDGNEFEKKVLNELVPFVGYSGIYNEMVERFYLPKTRVRISMGRLYMWISNGTDGSAYDGAYGMLHTKASESYAYLFSNFGKTILRTGEVAVEATRSRMFDTWFPIQREIANTMGHVILTSRGKEGFISPDLIAPMKEKMQPGDMMLQRRNWHLSNVGIPGFWTHAALYTGSLSDMEAYFASEFPREGFDTFSAYLKATYPEVWNKLDSEGVGGYPYSVIEAIEPGVIIQTLEKSGNADFIVTLRPNIKKADKLQAILRAFKHFGKPYDYNFDFDTKDALVCSELVYDAFYEHLPEKDGVRVDTSVVNGRKIVSPVDIAQKFKNEYGKDDAELSFVYFIQGNETTRTAAPSDVATFMKTVEWSKFSF